MPKGLRQAETYYCNKPERTEAFLSPVLPYPLHSLTLQQGPWIRVQGSFQFLNKMHLLWIFKSIINIFVPAPVFVLNIRYIALKASSSISPSNVCYENLSIRIFESGFLKFTGKEVGWWWGKHTKYRGTEMFLGSLFTVTVRTARAKGEANQIQEKCQVTT